MNQQERLLELLRDGPVTPLQAWIESGIYRPADPVEKLRKKGYVIDTHMRKFTTHRGYEVEFAEYRLVAEPKRSPRRGCKEE
jgi:hypothetical protein